MDSRHYWDEAPYNIKYENCNSNDGFRTCDGNLNFSTAVPPCEDDADYTTGYLKKGKIARVNLTQDPLSHRIIEKRRRDRMNNCLADLSRLIPPEYLKKGRGRIEKTEIIEMAIKHLKYLKEKARGGPDQQEGPISLEHFRLGYQECLSEVMRYMVEHQGHLPSDSVCVQIVHHLHRHCERIVKGDQLNKPRSNPETTSSSSTSSNNYSGGSIIAQNMPRSEVTAADAENKTSENAANSFSSHESDEFQLSCNDNPREISITQGTSSEMTNVLSQQTNTDYSRRNSSEDSLHQKGFTNAQRGVMDFPQNGCIQQHDSNDLNKYQDPPPVNHKEQMLRNVRKTTYPSDEHIQNIINIDNENAHSYKFKNTIQQRFTESQSYESRPSSPTARSFSPDPKRDQIDSNGKAYKRRRSNLNNRININNGDQSLYKSNSSYSSNENAINLSHESSSYLRSSEDVELAEGRYNSHDYYKKFSDEEIPPQSKNAYYKVNSDLSNRVSSKSTGLSVPIFALHAKGAFYVPLNIEYECLVPFLGPYDLLNVTGLNSDSSLHPVTISVNFQPSLFVRSKKEENGKPKSEVSEWH